MRLCICACVLLCVYTCVYVHVCAVCVWVLCVFTSVCRGYMCVCCNAYVDIREQLKEIGSDLCLVR